MIIFRFLLLVVVCLAGCIVFYARRDLEPRALVRRAAIRGLVVTGYVVAAYVGMGLVTRFFIDA